jgi:hypothetical protein
MVRPNEYPPRTRWECLLGWLLTRDSLTLLRVMEYQVDPLVIYSSFYMLKWDKG